MSRSNVMTDSDSSTASKELRLDPGIYKIVNNKTGVAIDLSGWDNKSIIGFPEHGWENQQWDFVALGAGYSIRSVHSGHYITVDSGIGDGVSLIASLFPVSWEVEADTFEEGTWRILWPNTQFNFDLSSPDAGNGQIQLQQEHSNQPTQLWRLIKVASSGTVVKGKPCTPAIDSTGSMTLHDSVSTTADTIIDAEGLRLIENGDFTVTTTTTTTTVTVTKVARVNCS